MANVELDELASAVMAELEEYAQYTAEALKESVKEAGPAVRDHLRRRWRSCGGTAPYRRCPDCGRRSAESGTAAEALEWMI